MGLWHVWLPTPVLGVPGNLPACARLWQPVPTVYNGLDAPREEFGDIEAWRPEASMPGCNLGWLAKLAGWQRWLASLVGWPGSAGWLAAAGGLLLAACCLNPVISHARRSRRSADSDHCEQIPGPTVGGVTILSMKIGFWMSGMGQLLLFKICIESHCSGSPKNSALVYPGVWAFPVFNCIFFQTGYAPKQLRARA